MLGDPCGLPSWGAGRVSRTAQGAVCLALVEEHLGAAVGCEATDAVERGAAGPAYVLTDCGGPAPEQGGPMCAGIVLYGVVPDGVSGGQRRAPRGPVRRDRREG